jgi:hypothetical protein
MTAGSVTSAITRSRPPQCGQCVISNSKTRFSRWAQVSGAVGRSLSSTAPLFGGLGPSSRHDGVFPLPLRCLPASGTTAPILERMLESVDDLTCAIGGKPLEADGRPRNVATQSLEAVTLMGLTGEAALSEKPF